MTGDQLRPSISITSTWALSYGEICRFTFHSPLTPRPTCGEKRGSRQCEGNLWPSLSRVIEEIHYINNILRPDGLGGITSQGRVLTAREERDKSTAGAFDGAQLVISPCFVRAAAQVQVPADVCSLVPGHIDSSSFMAQPFGTWNCSVVRRQIVALNWAVAYGVRGVPK